MNIRKKNLRKVQETDLSKKKVTVWPVGNVLRARHGPGLLTE